MRALIQALVIGAGAAGAPAWAHAGHVHPDAPLGWTWDPLIVVPLLASLGLFATGSWRLHRRVKVGVPVLRRRQWLFGCGWLLLAIALVSPLHQAGERSFTAHMVEHELLMLLAAPLLVMSRPLAIMLWAFPVVARRTVGGVGNNLVVTALWRSLTAPVSATLIQAAALWLWHAPMLFDLALASDGWHAAQHLSFLVSALLFWSAMLGRQGAASTAPATQGLAALCLFLTSIVSGALGALMAFAQSPWYVGYARLGMAPFGLTPAEDQQVAGLIMWIPGGLVHAAAALILVRALLLAEPRRRKDAHAC